MRLLSYNMPADWNYFLFGDNHIGAALRHAKGFRKMVKMMNSEFEGLPANRNFGADHGDFCEAILIDDPRFSIFENRKSTVLGQLEMAKKEYWSIKEKIKVMLDGNHPAKLHKFGPLTHYLCKELGINFGTYQAKITYTNRGKIQFKHFLAHGFGTTISSRVPSPRRRLTNKEEALQQKLADFASDCILMSMGHTHQLIVSSRPKVLCLTDDGKKINHHYRAMQSSENIDPFFRYYVNTGSFLKLYGDDIVEEYNVPLEQSKLGSGYAEQKGYSPTELGFAVALIRDNEIKDVYPVYL